MAICLCCVTVSKTHQRFIFVCTISLCMSIMWIIIYFTEPLNFCISIKIDRRIKQQKRVNPFSIQDDARSYDT